MYVYMIKEGVGGACFMGNKAIERAKKDGYKELDTKKGKEKGSSNKFDDMEKKELLAYALENFGADLDARKSEKNIIIEIQDLESKKMAD